MTETLLVTDSNIFFDLLSVNLFDSFFNLPYEIHTTDFVIAEIRDPRQKNQINSKIKSGELHVKSFESAELTEIVDMVQTSGTNASITDCSIWHYAANTGSALLTGDAKLRRAAENDGIKVYGILFVFDTMLAAGIITRRIAVRRLLKLLSVNPRLPHGECRRRIAKWTQ